jgi:hypothetical protein
MMSCNKHDEETEKQELEEQCSVHLYNVRVKGTSRIDIIGMNGPTGDHYDSSDNSDSNE